MIDIHSHILPGIDDGAKNLDEALNMCRICAEDGIEVIAATPHDLNGVYENDRDFIVQQTNALNQSVRSNEIPLEVVPGADIAMSPLLPEKLDSKSVMTMNDTGKYILLEPPLFFTPDALKRQVFEIRRRGIVPIITHPERIETLIANPELLYEAILGGALVQVTAGSLTGDFGPKVQKRSVELLNRRMVHIIASDSHNTNSRKPGLSMARTVAGNYVGKDEATRMVNDRPRSILRGEDITVEDPDERKSSSIFSMFFPWKK